MDFAQEEANLVYEDRMGGSKSPDPQEESDEEDRQQELEEMLYSHVYYDDTSIKAASPEPVPTTTSTWSSIDNFEPTKVARQLGFSSSGIDEPTASSGSLQLQAGCNRSQFNHPNRFKASRYYDNDSNKNSKFTFVVPSNPSLRNDKKHSLENQRFTKPSEFTTRLMARSAQEKSYKPKITKSVPSTNFKESAVVEVEDEIIPSKSPEKALPDISINRIVTVVDPSVTTSVTNHSPQSSTSTSLETTTDFDHSKESATSEESVEKASPRGKHNDLCSVTEKKKVDTSHVNNKGEKGSSKCTSPGKRSHDELSENSPRTRKLKQQSFEAKVSKVLSSMLDEESRSSIDEAPITNLHSNQNLKSSDADTSWSVGMSWADMSSKFSFGVDSIEEESVSSLQLQEGSSNADSRTHTPDLRERPEELEKDEESVEPSRYELQLKVPNKEASACESDSESEVGSVVEVAPPVKTPPPIVDLSDGEFVPTVNEKNRNKPIKEDIAVLYTKHSNKINNSVNFVIESSSDDDLVILDVIDNSKLNNIIQPRDSRGTAKRRSFESNLSGNAIPSKRLAVSNTTVDPETSIDKLQLLEVGQTHPPEKPITPKVVSKNEKLDQWLYNPIKSTKSLDHEKFLKKMSDDPKLWKLCEADVFNIRSSRYGPKCLNCNEMGHKTKLCTAPRKLVFCHMCGVSGHAEPRCPMKMCLRCGEKNGIYTDMCKKCINLVPCKICESRLHVWKLCPDLWRRFHLTTSSGAICKAESTDIRPRKELWCSNCAGKYHLSHECKKPQWKCYSITPFIRSYHEVNDQERILEGSTKLTMLITDDCAKLLSSSEGKQFLDKLATLCKLNIHTSFDVEYKKLVLEGTSVNQQETRQNIMDWCQKQKKLLDHEEFEKKAEALKAKSPLQICPVLPRDRDSLGIVLEHQLQLLESSGLLDKTVKQLYNCLQKNMPLNMTEREKQSTNRKKMKEERNKCSRLLNMILIGKCGFKSGKSHINALRALLGKLKRKGCPVVCGNVLYKKILKHFSPVFGYFLRDDFEELVKKFYSNNDFVKKYDYQQEKCVNDKVSVSEVSSSQSIQNVQPPISVVSSSQNTQNVEHLISEVSSSQSIQKVNPKRKVLCSNPNELFKKESNLLRDISMQDRSEVEKHINKLLDIRETLIATVPELLEKLNIPVNEEKNDIGKNNRIIAHKNIQRLFSNFCKYSTLDKNLYDEMKNMRRLVKRCQMAFKKGFAKL